VCLGSLSLSSGQSVMAAAGGGFDISAENTARRY